MRGNKQMMKKRWFILLVTLLTIGLITACTSNDEGSSTGKNNHSNEMENNHDEEQDWDNMEAEITIYGHMYNGNWEDMYQEHVEEKFPNYTFNFISAYDETS